MAVVFIAQSTLQQWADAGKVRLDDNVLTLVKEQKHVNLTPAVRFTEILGAEDDPHQLVGKVKTKTQLDELEAEHYMDSVLCGEVAYTVVEGFLGDLKSAQPLSKPRAPAPVALGEAKKAAPSAPRAAPPPQAEPDAASGQGGGDDEAAALSELFLNTVR